MNVSLTPELERLVNDKVATGLYRTASEVVREGLRLLKERDDRLSQLRAEIREGFAAIEKGEFSDYDASSITRLAEQVKSRGQKRLQGRTTSSTRRTARST